MADTKPGSKVDRRQQATTQSHCTRQQPKHRTTTCIPSARWQATNTIKHKRAAQQDQRRSHQSTLDMATGLAAGVRGSCTASTVAGRCTGILYGQERLGPLIKTALNQDRGLQPFKAHERSTGSRVKPPTNQCDRFVADLPAAALQLACPTARDRAAPTAQENWPRFRPFKPADMQGVLGSCNCGIHQDLRKPPVETPANAQSTSVRGLVLIRKT